MRWLRIFNTPIWVFRNPERQRYEYKVEYLELERVVEKLARYGDESWELVEAQRPQLQGGASLCVFKRVK